MKYLHQQGDYEILDESSAFVWNCTIHVATLRNVVTDQGDHVEVEIQRAGQHSPWHGCYPDDENYEFFLDITGFSHRPETDAIAGTITRSYEPGKRSVDPKKPGGNDDMGSFTGTKTSPY
jgi:hypothetical protein